MPPKTTQIVAENIVALPAESKQNKPKNPQDPVITYYEIQFQYRFAENVCDLFKVEFPRVQCKGGILKKIEPDGRVNYSMKLTFASERPDIKDTTMRNDVIKKNKAFIDNWDNVLYPAVGQKIVDNRKGLGKTPLAVTIDTFSMICKNPMYHPMDKEGTVIQGRDPTMFVKLNGFGQNKTRFYRPTNGDPELLPWSKLTKDSLGVDIGDDKELVIDFAPVVWIKKLYCGGGKLSIQMEMEQALLYEPPCLEVIQSSQSESSKKVVQNDPELLNRWEEAFKFLTSPEEVTPTKSEVPSKPEGVASSHTDFLSQNAPTKVPSPVIEPPKELTPPASPEKSPEPKKTKPTKTKKVVKKKQQPVSESEGSGEDNAGSDNE
jgi:hypothetical protein